MSDVRVLHWYPNFRGGGGVANIVLHLANAQARLGMEPFIASVDGAGMYGNSTPDPEVGLEVWEPTWQLRRSGVVLRGIPSDTVVRLERLHPDVVHVHGEFNPDNWWVPRLFDVPIVLSTHGAFHPGVFAKHARRGKSVYVRVARMLLYRRVGVLHAVSPMEEAHLSAAFPGTRVYCAPQGTSVPLAHALAGDGASGGARRPVRLLFIGRLDVFTKGLDLLVDAFAAAARRLDGNALHLTLVGPDWNGGRALVEERARAAGIAGRIHLAGAVSSAELGRLLPQFDCYVQLSRHESFGFGVADALAVGRPVIMTDAMGIASFPELATLPHVRVVKPAADAAADAIVDVAGDLAALRVEAMRARAGVRQLLSWDRIAEVHRANYETLLSASFTQRGDLAPRTRRLTSNGSSSGL